MVLTHSRKEYLLNLEDFSKVKHTGQHIANVIEEVINQISSEKFVAIVSDNGSNVASARGLIVQKYPNIINVRCIAHCFNLISTDIVKILKPKIVSGVQIWSQNFLNILLLLHLGLKMLFY